MLKQLKIRCPNCDETIQIELDDTLKVISLKICGIEVSNAEDIKMELSKRGIELG